MTSQFNFVFAVISLGNLAYLTLIFIALVMGSPWLIELGLSTSYNSMEVKYPDSHIDICISLFITFSLLLIHSLAAAGLNINLPFQWFFAPLAGYMFLSKAFDHGDFFFTTSPNEPLSVHLVTFFGLMGVLYFIGLWQKYRFMLLEDQYILNILCEKIKIKERSRWFEVQFLGHYSQKAYKKYKQTNHPSIADINKDYMPKKLLDAE